PLHIGLIQQTVRVLGDWLIAIVQSSRAQPLDLEVLSRRIPQRLDEAPVIAGEHIGRDAVAPGMKLRPRGARWRRSVGHVWKECLEEVSQILFTTVIYLPA